MAFREKRQRIRGSAGLMVMLSALQIDHGHEHAPAEMFGCRWSVRTRSAVANETLYFANRPDGGDENAMGSELPKQTIRDLERRGGEDDAVKRGCFGPALRSIPNPQLDPRKSQ